MIIKGETENLYVVRNIVDDLYTLRADINKESRIIDVRLDCHIGYQGSKDLKINIKNLTPRYLVILRNFINDIIERKV